MRYWMFLLGLLMYANVAEAIDCKTPPDCAELGYSKDNDPNCLEDGYMLCPFDFNFKKCVEKDCAKLGFTESDKTSWCGKIVKCEGNEKFTACACALPKAEPCAVGSVYYANGTCSSVENYQGCGTPVGVVYYVSDGGAHGKVINLHDLGRSSSSAKFDPANPYQTSNKIFPWGSYGTDISDLTNWECSGSDNNYLTVAKTGNHEDAFWSAGKSYTDLIVKALGDSSLQYAAGAARAFYPDKDLENDSKVGQGNWYLPTLGELMDLYGYNYTSSLGNCESSTGANGNTKTAVNATLTTLKSKGVTAETLTNNYYWSSSEYSSNISWLLNLTNGFRYYYNNYDIDYVRASLEF